MSSLQKSNASADRDIIDRGVDFYRAKLAGLLEPTHIGSFVAIEPDSGRYFIERTASAALIAAHAQIPDKLFFLTRVGKETAHTVGGHATRIRPR
jgi:hypothetical protein